MALRKDSTPAADNTPPFEADEATTVETTTATAEPTARAEPAAPAVATSVAVVPPTATAVSVAKVPTLMKSLKNAIATEDLEGMGFGVFPRITVTRGGFMVDKKESIGDRIRIEVVSWNDLWMVVTGEQSNAETNKLVKSSYDGKVLNDGSFVTVESYLAQLKAQGYDKAVTKKYAEIYGRLVAFEKLDGRTLKVVDVPEDEREIYQISLSPTSVGQWGRYQLEASLRKAQGYADDHVVTLIKQDRTSGPNDYANIIFSPKWEA